MTRGSKRRVAFDGRSRPAKRLQLSNSLGIFTLLLAFALLGFVRDQAHAQNSELGNIAREKVTIEDGAAASRSNINLDNNPIVQTSVITVDQVEENLAALEREIWMAPSFRLSSLEKQAVRAIQINPYSAMAHGLLSQILMRRFSLDPSMIQLIRQASDLAQQAIDLDPELDIGYVALAGLFDLMGTPDRGLQLLSDIAAAGLAPSWRVYFTRARLTSEATDTKQVLGLLRNAMSFRNAHQSVIAPYVVAVLLSSRSGEELVRDLRSWRTDFPNGTFDATLAEVLADHGQVPEAHKIYQEILKHNPQSQSELVSDAVLLYRSLNSPRKAILQIRQALKHQGPNDPMRPMILGHLGAAYLANLQHAEARLAFREAALLAPQDAALLQFVVQAYQSAGFSKELDQMLAELNQLAPGHGFLHAVSGENLSEKLGEHELALAAFENAIVLEPNRSDFYTGRGLTQYRLRDISGALKSFSIARDIDPADARAWYNEACALALLGRSQESVRTLEDALILDPSLVASAATDDDFKDLRQSARFINLLNEPRELPLEDDLGDFILGH